MKTVLSTLVAAAFLVPQVASAGSSINWNGDVMAGFRTQMAKRGRPLPKTNKKKQAGWGKARVDSMLARNPKKQSLVGSSIQFNFGSNGLSIRTYRSKPKQYRRGPQYGHGPSHYYPQWGWYRDNWGNLHYGVIPQRPHHYRRHPRRGRNQQRRGHDRNRRGNQRNRRHR